MSDHPEKIGHCAACAGELVTLRLEVSGLQGRMVGPCEQLESVERLCALLLMPLSSAGRGELRRLLDPSGGDVEVQELFKRLRSGDTPKEPTP